MRHVLRTFLCFRRVRADVGRDFCVSNEPLTTMTATTNGSGGLWDGGGEGRPTMNVTNIAELQFFYFFQEDPNRFPDL